MAKRTIRELLDLKGQRQILMTTAETSDIARAAELAGLDMLVTGAMDEAGVVQQLGVLRRGAPNMLVSVALPMETLVSDEEAIRLSLHALKHGADLVYPGVRPERVAVLAREGIPVHCHVGLVPSKATWFGGLRAVGKNADEAVKVYLDAKAYADAGAVLIEIECVPEKVAAEITKRVAVPVISMGCGGGCDGQYLFSCDILGTHNGRVPRHSKVYRNFFKESVDAFGEFKDDVLTGRFPTDDKTIRIEDDEFNTFMSQLA